MFKSMTEKKFQKKMSKIKKSNLQKGYLQKLRDEKDQCRARPKLETSKLIAIYLFLLLNAIVIYAMVAMWVFVDLSYLGVLISDIAAQVVIYAIYCMKAYKAKKTEEELKFERDKHCGTISDLLSAGANSSEYVPVNGNVETFTTNSVEENVVG